MKKLLATLLASAMAFTALSGLTACGGEEGGDDSSTLVVWAPSAGIEAYEERVADWKAENAEYSGWNVRFVPKNEGEAETDLSVDPGTGGDIVFFTSGLLKSMKNHNYLQTLDTEYKEQIVARDGNFANDVMIDGEDENGSPIKEAMAFPVTGDNGYFLWYNNKIFTAQQVQTWESLLLAATQKNVSINFSYDDGYYVSGLFFGTGCTADYTDDELTQYYTDVNDPVKGVAAGKAAINIFSHPKIAKGADGYAAEGLATGVLGASVRGTWLQQALEAKCAEGQKVDYDEDISCAKLPTFTVDGKTYQTGSFMGAKYCGINRYKSRDRIIAAMSLANYFADAKGQEKRFDVTGAGPTNTQVAAMQKVRENKVIAAIAAQNAAGGYLEQSQNGLWNAMAAFGGECQAKTVTTANLQAKLNTLAAGCRNAS